MTVKASLNAPLLLEPTQVDYVLLDSGHGRKLERLGGVVSNRPEPQAVWAPKLPESEWKKAVAVFAPKANDEDGDSGNWEVAKGVPDAWDVSYGKLIFKGRLTPFRHLGCFPDQSPQWAWLEQTIKPGMKVLNLFGYTGVASMVAAAAGAEVTHVDASKKAIGYGRENLELNGMKDAKIRWMLDDCFAFVAREVRRGNSYDIIIMDPPKYGRGPDGERWDFFGGMPEFLENIAKLTKPQGHVWLTAYALRVSSVALGTMLAETMPKGTTEIGEFVSVDNFGRRFTNSMWARWNGRA
ncbi:MAG: methyltransferase [Blastochloris viridis]|uniref:Methyltransferase n=1 Tax=Blastochloris viridis TaxID=1079 RepID=A0A6N4R5D8_BLAVI|nr:MAG: methyltransferase [Blastochloris viridis]